MKNIQNELSALVVLACKNWNVNGESPSDATWKLLEAKKIPENISFNRLMKYIAEALSAESLHNNKVYKKLSYATVQSFLSTQ